MGKLISLKIINEIIFRYSEGESANSIAVDLGIACGTVTSHLRKNDIRVRPLSERYINTVDKTVFDKINENLAYWIGFLMADGNVTGEELMSNIPPNKNHYNSF